VGITFSQYRAAMRNRVGPLPMKASPKIPRGMNGWEKDYANRLELLRCAGEITWYAFNRISPSSTTGNTRKNFRRHPGLKWLNLANKKPAIIGGQGAI
jgi:hypothetical protein